MSDTTEIYLVRHGETDWNAEGRFQGTTDVPLNDAGRRQAARLAAGLRAVPLTAAYTSPLLRAADTARAILEGRDLPLFAVEELREVHYGEWQGRLPAEVDAETEARWRRDPWSVRFPGGETLEEVAARAVPAIQALMARHAGGRILVSGHGHLNRVLLLRLLRMPDAGFWELTQANGSCVRLAWVHGAVRGFHLRAEQFLAGEPAGAPAAG